MSKKGKVIYLSYDEQILISSALENLIKLHQEKYEKEVEKHKLDKNYTDEYHLNLMLKIRKLSSNKF